MRHGTLLAFSRSVELQINIVLVALLGALSLPLLPTPAEGRHSRRANPHQSGLVALEDHVATHPADAQALLSLSRQYMELGQPALAVAVIQAADSDIRADEEVSLTLSLAYESSGRLLDATRAAQHARLSCTVARGSRGRRRCRARTMLAIDHQERSLSLMRDDGLGERQANRNAARPATLALSN